MKSYDYDILRLIVSDRYVNTNVLANDLGLSVRSIRYAIDRIKLYLEKYQCYLNYSNSRGYYFTNQEQLKVMVLLEELSNSKQLITNQKQRRLYIAGQISRSDKLSIKQLASDLYISESSVQNDCNQIILGYQQLESNNNYVINKMSFKYQLRFVVNLLINQSQMITSIDFHQLRLFFGEVYSDQKLQAVIRLVNDSVFEIDNKYLEFQVTGLIYYLLDRFALFNNIESNLHLLLKNNLKLDEYQMVILFLNAIGCHYELEYIGIYDEVTEFLLAIENYYQIDFMASELDIINLERRIRTIQLQSKLEIEFKYHSSKRNIRLYPYSFSISQQLLNGINKKNDYSRDQVAYICASIQHILFESSHIKSIIFIADDDVTVVDSYTKWIQSKYSKNMKIVVLTNSQVREYLNKYHDEVQFIINFTDSLVVTDIDVLAVSAVLSIDTLNKIDKMLSIENGNYQFFSNFVNQRMLKVSFNPMSLRDIFNNCANSLEQNGYIDDRHKYVEQCLKREEIGTTYIGYRTMISHPLKYAANNNVLFITILATPLQVLDSEVNIIISCAFKNEIDFDISRLFELIMKVVEKDQTTDLLISSKSEMELFINLRNSIIKL